VQPLTRSPFRYNAAYAIGKRFLFFSLPQVNSPTGFAKIIEKRLAAPPSWHVPCVGV
jgi:hypothetical protein